MFWRKKQKKIESPKEKNLFREAFLPSKKPVLQKQTTSRPANWRFIGIVSLWVLLLVTSAYALLVAPFHFITDISITGTVDVSSDRIDVLLRDSMKGKRFIVFPKSNFFLVSLPDMERSLLESFPKLRSVEVWKRFPNRLEVIVSERDRIPLWCSAGNCFLLRDDGTVGDVHFSEQTENESFLFRIEDSGARDVSLGDRVLDEKILSRILRIEQGIRESGIVAVAQRGVTPSRVSGVFRFTTLAGWDILVSIDPDPETTLASLRVILEKELPEDRQAKLRYIDLRTEKKVFYSFISDEPSKDVDDGDEKLEEEQKKTKHP
jgi:cell division septal protein FtsQ